MIDPPRLESQVLAHVADYDAELGEAVENAIAVQP
jgi:hypothetical protein